MNEVEDRIDDVYNRIRTLEEIQEEYDPKYLTSESILSLSQMPNIVVRNLIKSLEPINVSISLKSGQLTYSLNRLNGLDKSNIWAEDYINVFHHNETNKIDSFWVQGLHYAVREVESNGQKVSYLEILKPEAFNGGDILYITGLQLSNNREL